MHKEVEKYYAHGKFLLTAEYLVMAGAQAVVMPLNLGQYLSAWYTSESEISWKSYYHGDVWFEATFSSFTLEIQSSSDSSRAEYLQRMLKEALLLSSKIPELKGLSIETVLEFKPTWGMGSSSTLMVNVARLFDVNAFDLHKAMSKGSGFDIAAGMTAVPFYFRLQKNQRKIVPVRLPELFYRHAYFVYSGQKADSQKAVDLFHQKQPDIKMPVKYINEITAQFTEVETFEELSRITIEHENFMEEVLDDKSPLRRFGDYPYGMKSLGAWGGDFFLVMHPGKKSEVERYFHHKGCPLVFQAEELKIKS
ncbi:MAG: GYDIA family GHMP kinase [Bacteroidales bacterium]